jgi:PAS domain S-box-containing protein
VYIFGWLLKTPPLTLPSAGLPPMELSTAVGALLCAIALQALGRERHGRAASVLAFVCSVIAAAIGLASLLEHLQLAELRLNAIPLAAAGEALTMTLATSIMLFATGCGLLLLCGRRVVAAQWCALIVALFCAFSLQTWIYFKIEILTKFPDLFIIGPPTFAAFVLLSGGLLAARGHQGIMAVFFGNRPGGLMSRRLWLPLVVLAVAGGTFTEWVEVKEWIGNARIDSPTLVLWFVLLSTILIWLNARSLDRLDDTLRQTIQERAIAERVLRRQASLFDQSYEGLVISQVEGPITFWNRGAHQLYGFSDLEAMGRVPHELLSTTVAGGVTALHDQLKREHHWEGELRHLRKDGRELIVDTRMTLVTDEGGAFIVAASRDITERVRAESAVRDSERRFREIAEWLPQLVWTCEADGWCDFLSQRWIDYTGSTLAREVGYGWLNQIHPDDQQQLMTSWKASVDTGTEFRIEFRIRRHDGAFRWFDTRALPLRDERGQIVKWFGSNTDIEDERAIRETLRSNEERLALALEINQTAAWDFDITTNEVHRSVEHDRIFGYEALQPVWTFEHFIAHVAPDERDRIRRRFERTLTSPVDAWSFDCRIQRCDHELRWIAVRGRSRRDEDGAIRTLSGVVQDVTDRKQIEEEITRLNTDLEGRVEQRTQELEAANRELEAFSYSVSHDLRAPLRTVDGFSQAVLEDFGEELPAEGQRYLRIIRDGAQRMGRLIDDLLSFSRLSRQPLNARPIDMRELACDSWQEINAHQECAGAEVVIETLPLSAGDPALLRQVWLNLLSNALKYSRGRKPPRVYVGSRRENGHDIFYVRDNGTGFDMQYAHKLFGVFQRLHRSEDFEGTGVGLAVVQRIIHRHGGQIWADAVIDKGATFFFTLGPDGDHREQPSS